MDGWSEFNVAMAGASAALAGLIMIAISVNIKEVLRFPSISARAGGAIATLVVAVVASCISLMPQPILAIGVELLVATSILWVVEGNAIRGLLGSGTSSHNLPHRTATWKAGNIALGLLSPLAFTAGGVLLACGQELGAFPVAFGSLIAIVSAVLFAWVAMVEILR